MGIYSNRGKSHIYKYTCETGGSWNITKVSSNRPRSARTTWRCFIYRSPWVRTVNRMKRTCWSVACWIVVHQELIPIPIQMPEPRPYIQILNIPVAGPTLTPTTATYPCSRPRPCSRSDSVWWEVKYIRTLIFQVS